MTEKLRDDLAHARLDAEIFEAMYGNLLKEHSAYVEKSRARLANIRRAVDWLWGFWDGNTLLAKSGYEDDIREAWDELLAAIDMGN